MKWQIQMHKNILPNLKNNTGGFLDTEAVDWVDKYLQIGSAYYFTQRDSEKQIGYRTGFYLQHLRLEAFRDLLELFNRPEQPTHYTPSPISLACVINIFLPKQSAQIVLQALLLFLPEDNLMVWFTVMFVQTDLVDF